MMPAVQETRLFVYGTLKRGFAGRVRLDGSRYEGSARTAPGYALHDLGPYPALVVAGQGTVEGELHWVTTEHLARLDEYEGPEYARESIVLADGSRAEAYVMPVARVVGTPCIPGGVWRPKPSADF
jgi:gamma-glutamylcyclotransferase (GGCT)/AIG2-like uncharacterized protein YtfP